MPNHLAVRTRSVIALASGLQQSHTLNWNRTEDTTISHTSHVSNGVIENTGAVEVDPYTSNTFTGNDFYVTYTDDNSAGKYYFLGFTNDAVPAANSFSPMDFGIGWHPSAPLAYTVLINGSGFATIARSQGDSIKMVVEASYLKFYINGAPAAFTPELLTLSGPYKLLLYTFGATNTIISITGLSQ